MARKSRKNNTFVPEKKQSFLNTAFYVRLSAEDIHHKGDSIENQKRLLENFVNLNPEFHVIGTYVDNGKTGTNFEREGFQKMIQDIEKGKIQCVMVKDLSRLGRNLIDTGYYIQNYFTMKNIRCIAINDGFDTEQKNGNDILLPILNMMNESYAFDISKKKKQQVHTDMVLGKFVSGKTPYGYQRSAEDCHKLVIDTEVVEVVQNIFQWAVEEIPY